MTNRKLHSAPPKIRCSTGWGQRNMKTFRYWAEKRCKSRNTHRHPPKWKLQSTTRCLSNSKIFLRSATPLKVKSWSRDEQIMHKGCGRQLIFHPDQSFTGQHTMPTSSKLCKAKFDQSCTPFFSSWCWTCYVRKSSELPWRFRKRDSSILVLPPTGCHWGFWPQTHSWHLLWHSWDTKLKPPWNRNTVLHLPRQIQLIL